MSDEVDVAETWLEAALTGDATVNALISGRVFDAPPPENTTYPYVIYNPSSMNDVRGVGTTRIASDTMFTVKAVAQTDDHSVLTPLVSAMDDALTLSQPASVSGGTVHSCVRERPVKYREFTNGKHFVHRGGEYAIFVQAD